MSSVQTRSNAPGPAGSPHLRSQTEPRPARRRICAHPPVRRIRRRSKTRVHAAGCGRRHRTPRRSSHWDGAGNYGPYQTRCPCPARTQSIAHWARSRCDWRTLRAVSAPPCPDRWHRLFHRRDPASTPCRWRAPCRSRPASRTRWRPGDGHWPRGSRGAADTARRPSSVRRYETMRARCRS